MHYCFLKNIVIEYFVLLPQISMSTERPLNKYSLPGRIKPLNERTPNAAQPSWDTVSRILDITTRNHQEDHKLYIRHRQILKRTYDGWFDVVTKGDRTKLEKISDDFTNLASPMYNPMLLDQLGPLTSQIRDSFPALRSQRSKS